MDFSPIDGDENSADKEDVPEYAAGGKKVVCGHCGSTGFTFGTAKLNTTMMTFLDLDWLNRSASLLIFTNCGKIQWFLKNPERIE